MHNDNKTISRCPVRDKIYSLVTAFIVLLNSIALPIRAEEIIEKEETEVVIIEEPAKEIIVEVVEESILLKTDEIISEINSGMWGDGEDRKNRLIEAGYDYYSIQQKVNEQYSKLESLQTISVYASRLTKKGGIYYNPKTGLKETWYSQRVLPGGGLKIPGRHVNSEGFVCDIDGYICVASSTYQKGTIIETSRGMGKVYDCGCAPGILDIYVDW